MSGWNVLLPEGVLVLTLILVLLADLILPRERRGGLPLLAAAGAAVALAGVWLIPEGGFGQAFAADALARYLKTILLGALLLVVLLSWEVPRAWRRPSGELLVLLLSASLGMMILASGTELVLLYVGLELATFPLVLAVAYRPADPRSAEGGLKYLILAALGSAILLFGLSLIYAGTGATQADELMAVISEQGFGVLTLLGLLCLLAGIGFKTALVPFHMWVPDAYEGAPTPVTAFLSVASKTAGFALALRLLAAALPAMRPEWGPVLAVLAAASMTLGNLAAIPQTNLKRLLAYSSIAQAGYIVMGLVAFDMLGLSALLYYLAAYLFTNVAVFAVVIAVEHQTGATEVAGLAGLAQRSPRLALVLLLGLLSLAGIPPLAGFTAKFYLFAAVFGQGYVWLVIVAVLNSALSLYYYLRVVRMAYIQPPAETTALRVPVPLTAVLAATLVGILVLGVYPAPFVNAARAALAAWW